MEKKLLVPKKGVKVRDPMTGKHFPETGAVRVIDSYYDRRIKDKDLEIQDVPVERTRVIAPAGKKPTDKKDGDK